MLVIITYDVNVTSQGGARRLRKVSKACQNYGQRVQNSVFECVLDSTQLKQLKIQLTEIIDQDKDSLRFYNLGKNYKTKVDHIGVNNSYDIDEPLIF
ncbi:CRISPR-associated endonuclease Cas2 [Pontibacillus litoralis]|uniref:CRISPR-associated endoribonuclease Cas2 n=1 Tax=Pontibacillus litoralis JSM 072002 TaxID=1385512 RepID=A0A0A5G835_9BACI|nr:CRISPR-associated endonuclease Cas2 [Pontibacillus litoralis]KGX88199.1 CRISPR-associated protein Cas2 [Pontibacillus litoralis JSM 072002]